jgi:hypothetical protein
MPVSVGVGRGPGSSSARQSATDTIRDARTDVEELAHAEPGEQLDQLFK